MTYAHGLSVIVLARNSARTLAACLHALQPLADEIVLVDTGSEDDTIAIAVHHGCRVAHFAWCDDFAKARNFAIEQARYRWILSVDTDEIVVGDEAAEVIARAIANDATPAYLVYQDNEYDNGEIKPNPVARLFQNHPLIRFRNPVHECISEDIREHFAGHPLTPIDVHLRHVGYLAAHQHGKHARNLAILQRWSSDDPDNLFANFKLGHMLWEAERPAEALPYLHRAYAQLANAETRAATPYLSLFIYVYHEALRATGSEPAATDFAAIATQWLGNTARW